MSQSKRHRVPKFKDAVEVFEYLAVHYKRHSSFLCLAVSKVTDDNPELKGSCLYILQFFRPKPGVYGTDYPTGNEWWSFPEAPKVIAKKKAFLRAMIKKLKELKNY
jgi:hypothetical protein